jgi:protein-S-isoprenylcysteine O-methyltransferase Ste14
MKLLRAAGIFFSTAVVYSAPSLLGWGAGHLPAFFASAPRVAYTVCLLVFSLLVGIQAYHSLEGIQDSPGRKETLIRRQTQVGALLVGLLVLGMFLLPFTSRKNIAVFPEYPVIGWVSVLFCGLGYLLIFWSGWALGRQYSAEVVLQKDHQLITSGPYRLIRHPRYLGIVCLSLGLTLLFHSWIGLGISAIVLGLLLYRIWDEERLLRGQFGAAWQMYVHHSWRLIPYLF